MDEIQREYFESLKKEEEEELTKAQSLISDFIKYCSEKGVALEQKHFRYMYTIGLYVEYPNILRLISGIQCDKDNLYQEDDVLKASYKQPFIDGYYYADKYMIMAHQYFRRGYAAMNNFAPKFIKKFWELTDNNIAKYIALDENRVRINVNNVSIRECDTWYGAPFTNDISSIKDGVVVLAPPADIPEDYDYWFGEVHKLDIIWRTNNSIKEFQAEEIKKEHITIVIDGITYHPVRYIHSEYDTNIGCFRHFDGAIHLYTQSEYAQRKNSDMNFNNKNYKHIKASSIKLFKMNGNISVDIWADFVSHFFTQNPLVYEYFTGKFHDHTQRFIDNIRTRLSK